MSVERIVEDVACALAEGLGVAHGTRAFHCLVGAVREAAERAIAIEREAIVCWLRTSEGDGWTRDSDRLADAIEAGEDRRKPDDEG